MQFSSRKPYQSQPAQRSRPVMNALRRSTGL